MAENLINHLAVVSEDFTQEQLAELFDVIAEKHIKVLSLYSSFQLGTKGYQDWAIQGNHVEGHDASFKFYQFPWGKARERFLEKIKEILIDKHIDLDPAKIEEAFREDPEYGEPDLIIRASKDKNSLDDSVITEANYAELFFIKKNPADLIKQDFELAIDDFTKRKRNFGV